MDNETRITDIERLLPTLATKVDFAALRTDFANLRADCAEIRADIHKSIQDNVRWTHTATIGMYTTSVLGVVGFLFTMWNASNRQFDVTPAPTSAPVSYPVIITVPPSMVSSLQQQVTPLQ